MHVAWMLLQQHNESGLSLVKLKWIAGDEIQQWSWWFIAWWICSMWIICIFCNLWYREYMYIYVLLKYSYKCSFNMQFSLDSEFWFIKCVFLVLLQLQFCNHFRGISSYHIKSTLCVLHVITICREVLLL